MRIMKFNVRRGVFTVYQHVLSNTPPPYVLLILYHLSMHCTLIYTACLKLQFKVYNMVARSEYVTHNCVRCCYDQLYPEV